MKHREIYRYREDWFRDTSTEQPPESIKQILRGRERKIECKGDSERAKKK